MAALKTFNRRVPAYNLRWALIKPAAERRFSILRVRVCREILMKPPAERPRLTFDSKGGPTYTAVSGPRPTLPPAPW